MAKIEVPLVLIEHLQEHCEAELDWANLTEHPINYELIEAWENLSDALSTIAPTPVESDDESTL